MTGYLAKRAAALVPVLLALSLLVFLIIHLIPGDPVAMMLGEMGVSKEVVENVRQQLGLNDPLWVQYGRFLKGLARGDLGRSFLQNRAVTDMIMDDLPNTLQLALAGLGVATLLGVGFGVTASVRRGSRLDNAVMALALLGVSMPAFWLGLMLIFLFSLKLGLLPATGGGGLSRLILPAIALGMEAAGTIARLTRSSMLDVLGQEYITTARSKGLAERVVIYRHALKNALIPVITLLGLEFGRLMGGTVVIETVFSRPGVGRLLVSAILGRDFPVVQGAVFVSATIYVLANLVVDISYAFVDPRIRYGYAGEGKGAG